MTAKNGSLAPERQNVAAGIGLMLVGFFLFSANDALGKWLAATYTPGQILLFRSALGLVVLAPFIARAGSAPSSQSSGRGCMSCADAL